MFTILHLSDLHRSPDEPVDNVSLLASLVNDLDRARRETPPCPPPDAIIVSGDIIQGARIAQKGWATAVREQYDVAEAFLGSLADTFLDGDRSRLILIPGNHDVCWNTAFEAMEEVHYDPANQTIRSQLNSPESTYRWDWSKLKLYRIQDLKRYDQRLGAYWSFVERFYAGANLAHSIDPNRGYQLFELNEGRIVVAAFDSTHQNDCYAYAGAFSPSAAGSAFLKLRDLTRSADLKIAVWHHSVQGPPNSNDYMDVGQVHALVGHGFQLGLHGHQHIAAEAAYYVHRAEAQKMAVISAGSLCAGSRELPRGVNRQYNVIVVDDDHASARLHVREMGEGAHFASKRSGAFLEGFIRVDWQPPLDLAGRPVDVAEDSERRAVDEAENALNSGDPLGALRVLETVALLPASYARALALRAAVALDDHDAVARIIDSPASVTEAVQLVSSFERLGRLPEALLLLENLPDIDISTKRALQDRIEIKLRIKTT
ncbi:metallophosphoesterase [Brevundimonas sp.]|uniref:metallophosphoesterase family protein n=1 Tax=Brevundimonas sp. TaxID=1871086 RepID=UPI0026116B8F|nr:metallophosphoesterase [Brevundimonas sp.]